MTLNSCCTFTVTHRRYLKHKNAEKGSSLRLHHCTSPVTGTLQGWQSEKTTKSSHL